MWWGAVAVVALAALEMGPVESYALVLMLLGLVSGFMYPIEDVTTRVGYYILAVLLPGIADAGGERSVMGDGVLMDIPVAGPFLHGFLVNFALVIAGVAIASFLLVLYKGLMAAGDDSDDGAAEPEAAAPEAAAPETPSWGGDDSAGSDSDDGDDEDRGY